MAPRTLHRVRLGPARVLPDRTTAQRFRALDEHDDRAAFRAGARRAGICLAGWPRPGGGRIGHAHLHGAGTGDLSDGPAQDWRGLLVTPARHAFNRFKLTGEPNPPTGTGALRSSGRRRCSPTSRCSAGGADLSMRAFLDFAAGVHGIVGTRKTIVTDLGGRAWTGALYFLADLTPAPYPFDRETMAINADLRAAVVDHIRAHPSDYECLIGTSLQDPEAVAFLETHPGAVEHQWMLPAGDLRGPQTVHILLANGQS